MCGRVYMQDHNTCKVILRVHTFNTMVQTTVIHVNIMKTATIHCIGMFAFSYTQVINKGIPYDW